MEDSLNSQLLVARLLMKRVLTGLLGYLKSEEKNYNVISFHGLHRQMFLLVFDRLLGAK